MAENDNQKEDRRFSKELQNVPKPVNNTEPSKEMQDYLDDLNSGRLKSAETLKREKEGKETEEKYKSAMVCPHCRRPGLKKIPSGVYACGFCGLTTNSPGYIYKRR